MYLERCLHFVKIVSRSILTVQRKILHHVRVYVEANDLAAKHTVIQDMAREVLLLPVQLCGTHSHCQFATHH